jgi:pyruvate dehydrogenase phosphatase
MNLIAIPAASSSENLQALAAVSDFATTDMGRGGKDRWTYRILKEPALTSELTRMAHARSHRSIDSITFQPCLSYDWRNQDRCLVEELALPDGVWLLSAVLDGAVLPFHWFTVVSLYNFPGHAGHDTVDHVLQTLPSAICRSLRSALMNARGLRLSTGNVEQALADAIASVDHSITSEFVDIFPRDLGQLSKMSDGLIHRIVNDKAAGARNFLKASRCIQGTTILLSLVDPQRRNLWVANLGDSRAGICDVARRSFC